MLGYWRDSIVFDISVWFRCWLKIDCKQLHYKFNFLFQKNKQLLNKCFSANLDVFFFLSGKKRVPTLPHSWLASAAVRYKWIDTDKAKCCTKFWQIQNEMLSIFIIKMLFNIQTFNITSRLWQKQTLILFLNVIKIKKYTIKNVINDRENPIFEILQTNSIGNTLNTNIWNSPKSRQSPNKKNT